MIISNFSRNRVRGCIDIEICGFDEVFKSFSKKYPSTKEDKYDTGKVRDIILYYLFATRQTI